MLKPRIIIRWFKHASLVLIALPEPFTTAIGVVLLGITLYVSHALSKVIEKSLNQQARERLASYFAHFRHFDNGAEASVPVEAGGHQSEPIRVCKTEDGDTKADLRSSILIGLPDGQDSSLHHTIDHKSLAKCYGFREDSPGGRLQVSGTPVSARRFLAASGSETGAGVLIHHVINREGLYRRYSQRASVLPTKPVTDYVQTGSVVAKIDKASLNSRLTDAPSIHHTVNMKHLQKRFGPGGREPLPKVYREDFDLLGVFSSF